MHGYGILWPVDRPAVPWVNPAAEMSQCAVGIDRFVGLDLAWRDSQPGRAANETGVAVLDPDGRVVDAGWTGDLMRQSSGPPPRPASRRCCSSTLHWSSTTPAANEHARPRSASGTGAGRSAPTPPTCARRGWPASPCGAGSRSRTGGTPTATADHRRTGAGAASATRTQRWSAPPSWATTSSARGTSASHRLDRRPVGTTRHRPLPDSRSPAGGRDRAHGPGLDRGTTGGEAGRVGSVRARLLAPGARRRPGAPAVPRVGAGPRWCWVPYR
jgi:hypothetical protein